MDENKGFNLKVLISLIVGVISLIVIIPTISMIMNKTKPEEVKPEEYRLIINKDLTTFYFGFKGPGLSDTTTLTQSFGGGYYDNLVSLTTTRDKIIMVVSYPDEDSEYYLSSVNIQSGSNYGNYDFTYLDPISNEKLYGTYDFSNIILTQTNQVINPIYTPF